MNYSPWGNGVTVLELITYAQKILIPGLRIMVIVAAGTVGVSTAVAGLINHAYHQRMMSAITQSIAQRPSIESIAPIPQSASPTSPQVNAEAENELIVARVESYFDFLQSGQPGQAWPMLSTEFRERGLNNDYDAYSRFWSDRPSVSLNNPRVTRRSDTHAVVALELGIRGTMPTGDVAITLVRQGSDWKIDRLTL